MGKKSSQKNKNANHRTTPNSLYSSEKTEAKVEQNKPSDSLREPSPEQIKRLESAESQKDALIAEHGPPSAISTAEQASLTLEDSLKLTEKLLHQAQALYESAQHREREAKAAQEQFALQKLEQDDVLEQQRIRNEILAQREETCQKREVWLAEQNERLAAREANARIEFWAERMKILAPLDNEVTRLENELNHLRTTIEQRECEAEKEARTKKDERLKRWDEQRAERELQEHKERLEFCENMRLEREEKLAELRKDLRQVREKAESEWLEELKQRRAVLGQREADFEKEQRVFEERAKAHREAEQKLRMEQEIFTEDCKAQECKITRLVEERTEDLRHDLASTRTRLEDARAKRDVYFKELESLRELERRFGGRKPEEILASLDMLERERDLLAQQLRERPDARDAERLECLERERSAWLEERAELRGELAKAQGELDTRRLAAIELESLRKHKEALEVHKQLLNGAVDELRAHVNELTRQEDHRNPMTALASLDEMEELQREVQTITPTGKATPTLRDFAEDLRHRIAKGVTERTLYYAERDVRAFLGGLAMTRLMLLQGISGTGKTSLPLAFANAVGGGLEVVEVQAGWRDRQDLIGYYNAFHRHYYATNFLQSLYKAGTPAYKDRLFIIILDEINLSRPEQFFADFLSALEQPMESRRLTLVNDPVSKAPRLMVEGRHLPVPPNVWFIGTANHDESTAEFADKTYDRAHVMEMPRVTEASHFEIASTRGRKPISYSNLEKVFADSAGKNAGQAQAATKWLREASFAKSLEQRFRVGWGNRLENQLARYLPVIVEAGGTPGEAMDHLLATKVLRKLKDRHDVRAPALEELKEQLENVWPKLDSESLPERCIELIEHEITAKKGEELA